MMNNINEMDTKQRLLAAAVKVFAAKGFRSATVREICQEADVNVAAVNYHFGDKGQLYGMVLEHIFLEHELRRDPELTARSMDASLPCEERLRAHILAGTRQIYRMDCDSCDDCAKGGPGGPAPDGDCAPFSIFLMEMAHPSPHLDEIVRRFIAPDAERLRAILRDFLGPDAPDALIDECGNSIWGQVLHQAMCWPIEERLLGEAALRVPDPDALGEHIYRITLGGLRLIRDELNTQTI